MGVAQTLRPYLVDLALIRSASGSKNAALAFDLHEKYEKWFDLGGGMKPTLRAAMFEILNNQISRYGETSSHWFAIEILCDYFGQSLPRADLEALAPGWQEEVDAAFCTLGISRPFASQELFAYLPDIGIVPPKGAPRIGRLTSDIATLILHGHSELDFRKIEEPAKSAARTLISWLRETKRHGHDLIVYSY